MDHFDRERYITIYKMLAEILERDRPRAAEEHHLSFALGDLARRIFVDARYLPPVATRQDVLTVRAPQLDRQIAAYVWLGAATRQAQPSWAST